jgi:hypothetical protein
MHAHPLLTHFLGLAFVATATAAALSQGDPFAQADAQACQEEFLKLKGELDKRAAVLKAAGERKAEPKATCPLFRRYVEAEAKLVNFFVQKKSSCQIPDPLVKQAKDGHAKALTMRTKVCQAAASGGASPPPPPSMGLSGAIGSTNTTGAPPAGTQGGSGVFDTLTGNVLQR